MDGEVNDKHEWHHGLSTHVKNMLMVEGYQSKEAVMKDLSSGKLRIEGSAVYIGDKRAFNIGIKGFEIVSNWANSQSLN